MKTAESTLAPPSTDAESLSSFSGACTAIPTSNTEMESGIAAVLNGLHPGYLTLALCTCVEIRWNLVRTLKIALCPTPSWCVCCNNSIVHMRTDTYMHGSVLPLHDPVTKTACIRHVHIVFCTYARGWCYTKHTERQLYSAAGYMGMIPLSDWASWLFEWIHRAYNWQLRCTCCFT